MSRPLAFRIPLVGRIVAGLPDLAWEETEGFIQLDDLLPGSDRDVFALKVMGASLKDKGIQEGDIAVVKKQKTADAGDIIAALIENEATVKILKKNGREIYLAPANDAYPEIHRPFVILGKVVAVLKRF